MTKRSSLEIEIEALKRAEFFARQEVDQIEERIKEVQRRYKELVGHYYHYETDGLDYFPEIPRGVKDESN